MTGGDHYFTASPASASEFRTIEATLLGEKRRLTTANGIFSPDHVDTGTSVLLSSVPEAPPGGDLLDLGCGWGPIALTLGLESPRATVWAVDVNERAVDLVARNAASLGLTNVNAVTPANVPTSVRFQTIWSNPPIRVGKSALHELLLAWLPRLERGSDAWLVVQRNLGSDSLQRWMDAELEEFAVSREGVSKGFRVLRAHRREAEAA